MYLYFAGGEAHCPRLHEYGVRRMLASFHYLDKKRKRKGYAYMEDMFRRYPDVRWFMDSGAFTLQKEGCDEDEAERFLERYIYALKQWKKKLECCCELDLDNFMGMGWVRYARERIINETGMKPIIVHHPETRSFDEFRRDVKEHPYMGFSIGDGSLFHPYWQPRITKIDLMNVHPTSVRDFNLMRRRMPLTFKPFYLTAKASKTKLHAFGITQPRILQAYHFYSCDSFSWSMGAKFGTTFINNRWEMYRYNNHEKRIRRTLMEKCKRYGVPFIDVLNDKYVAVDKMNVIAWMEAERAVNRVWGLHYCGEPRGIVNEFPELVGLPSRTAVNPLNVKVISKNRRLKISSFFSRSNLMRKRQTGEQNKQGLRHA